MIIGLTGAARSGKDEAAKPLLERGFRRIAFADPLKRACREIFGLTDQQLYGDLKDSVDQYWGVTPRHILQVVGTECLRDHFRADVWIKALCRTVETGDWVVTDVRFPDEAEAIRQLDGFIWRIERPDGPTIATAQHASETQTIVPDRTLTNRGTVERLHRQVIMALHEILYRL